MNATLNYFTLSKHMRFIRQIINIHNLNKTCRYFGIKYIDRIYLDENLYLLELVNDIYALIDSDGYQLLMIKYQAIDNQGKYKLIFQAQNKSITGIRFRNLFEMEIDAPFLQNKRDSMRFLLIKTIQTVSEVCKHSARENREFIRCLSLCRWELILKSKLYEISEMII